MRALLKLSSSQSASVMGLPLPLATCLSWTGPPISLGGGSARAVFLLVSHLSESVPWRCSPLSKHCAKKVHREYLRGRVYHISKQCISAEMIPAHRGFGATRRMRGIRKKQSELGFCFLLVAATPVLWLLVFFFILFFSQTKRFDPRF